MPSIYLTTNLHNKMLGIVPYQYIGSDQAAKQKMRLAKVGRIYDEIYGNETASKLRKEKSERYSESGNHNSLVWEITFPDGHKELITGLREFCRLNSLPYYKLYNSTHGYKSIKFGTEKGGRNKCLKI